MEAAKVTTKSICLNCGKAGNCLYEDAQQMAYCPTRIKPKVNRNKRLTQSPFSKLSILKVSKHE